MKIVRLTLLALLAPMVLTGCSSNKYYDLGYELATAEGSYSCIWKDESPCKRFYEEDVDVNLFCRQVFDEYLDKTNDTEFLNASTENVKSVMEGCKAGYPVGVKSRFP